MLTRLHIEGFKNLRNVDVRLGPFTAFVGENGVGKSNVFDAIRFLTLLLRHPIPEAVSRLRDPSARAMNPAKLFTSFEGYRADELRFVADMVVPREVEDDYGVRATASITSLRYEVAFKLLQGAQGEQLEVVHESLMPRRITESRGDLRFPSSKEFREAAIIGRRPQPLMSTHEDGAIQLHQEGHGGRKVPMSRSSRVVLQSANADFPTLLAARREIESWRSLLLEPSSMRAPSGYRDSQHIDEHGGNVPGTIERLRRERGDRVLAEIANRIAELLPEVREVRLTDDPRSETFTLDVCGSDRVFHSARALSDGTLRFLVLSVLAADPTADGLLCLEEPENGIHPDRVGAMVGLLRDLALDPLEAPGDGNPLRQVLINTHSPLVFNELHNDEVIFVELDDLVVGTAHGRATRTRVPDSTWRSEAGGDLVAPGRQERWRQMNFDFSRFAAE